MHLQLNTENFKHTLDTFSTPQLESILVKFPYFQQGHLLLAKKYELENNAKFDEQLRLAALYTHDRELLFSIFNTPYDTIATEPKTELEISAEPIATEHETEQIVTPSAEEIITTTQVSEPFTPAHAADFESKLPEEQLLNPEETIPLVKENVAQIIEHTPLVEEPTTEDVTAEIITPKIETKTLAEEPVSEVVNDEEITKPSTIEFNTQEPHTFNEWLNAYNPDKKQPVKLKIISEEIPAELDKQDKELEVLYLTNIPINLNDLVQEETQYSKGLDKFIEEQIQKRKYKEPKIVSNETDLDPELITETMAKVYEIQKKYTKAIRCYEILSLKYPKKIDLFAARINYLKNII